MRTGLLIPALLVLAIGIGGRIAGPSDLSEHDQTKTVSYTIDMLRHDRWLLPRDVMGEPASKPPLYNWLAAPVVAAFGSREWSLKAPSILAGLCVFALCVGMHWRLVRERRGDPPSLAGVALLSGTVWASSYPAIKLGYLARPDMLLTALLVAGWVAATWLLRYPPESPGRRLALQIALWGSVAGAALTKGPPALLPVLYIVVGAALWPEVGRAPLRRTGIGWGLALAAVVLAMWAVPVHSADPLHFTRRLVRFEILGRLTDGQPAWQVPFDAWRLPLWSIERFFPWSIIVAASALPFLLGRLGIGRSVRSIGPVDDDSPRAARTLLSVIAPPLLWIGLVFAFYSCAAAKRADYLAAAYPALAIVTVELALARARSPARRTRRLAWLAVAVAAAVVGHHWLTTGAARNVLGQRAKDFARQVEAVVGSERVVFVQTGNNPVQALCGQNQVQPLTDAELDQAAWIVAPLSVAARLGLQHSPVVRSGPVANVFGNEQGVLGLFPRDGIRARR